MAVYSKKLVGKITIITHDVDSGDPNGRAWSLASDQWDIEDIPWGRGFWPKAGDKRGVSHEDVILTFDCDSEGNPITEPRLQFDDNEWTLQELHNSNQIAKFNWHHNWY